MASGAYQAFKKSLLDRTNGGGIDFDADTLKLLLVSADQAANLNTHDNRDDITQEVTGTNYAAGGVTLSGVTVTASGGVATLDAIDATFSNVTIAAIRGSVLYKSTGSAAADPLAFWHDHGAQAVTAANYVVQWNASGIATLT
jgi:hypothetical protein